VVLAGATNDSDPLCIFGRTWDPDRRLPKTIMLCAGVAKRPLIELMEKSGFTLLASSSPDTVGSGTSVFSQI
jgi:hypothetical protein